MLCVAMHTVALVHDILGNVVHSNAKLCFCEKALDMTFLEKSCITPMSARMRAHFLPVVHDFF